MKIQTRFIDFMDGKYGGSGKLGLSRSDVKRKRESLMNNKKMGKEKLDKWKDYFDKQIIFRDMNIEEKANEAMKFIKKKILHYEKKGCNIYVGFSGGKDSLVTLDLIRRVQEDNDMCIDDIPAIYADTTLMDKVVNKYVETLNLSDYRWNIKYRLPLHDWEYFCKHIRPPSNTCRWGDKLLKNYPIMSYLRSKILNDSWERGKINAFIGTRADEGIKRKYYGRIDYNKFSKMYNLYPIYYFTTKDIWEYITTRKLEYCKVYDQGRKRVGCLICPMNSNGRDEEYLNDRCDLKKFKSKYYGYLIQYAEEHLIGDGKENNDWLWDTWINGNQWRTWSTVTGKDLVQNVVCKRVGNLDDGLVYTFGIDIDIKKVRMFLKPFYMSDKWKRLINIDIVRDIDGYLQLHVKYFHYGSKKLFNAFEAQLLKAINCISCGYCEIICDNIEIDKLTYEYNINNGCNGCLKCCKLGECVKWGYSNVKNVIECDRKVGTYHYQNG